MSQRISAYDSAVRRGLTIVSSSAIESIEWRKSRNISQ